MSDLFDPYEKLITITVLGKTLQVPENNLLLRQMSFVAQDIACGRYCWNGECRYCEVSYRKDAGAPEYTALACRTRGLAGMQVTKVASEIKYNMAEALAAAPAAKD